MKWSDPESAKKAVKKNHLHYFRVQSSTLCFLPPCPVSSRVSSRALFSGRILSQDLGPADRLNLKSLELQS